ncbi:response regulator transcription factor [Flavitalea sp. BT771]|uniref:response regulator transcription factor n=1 Tax=Flavitalea sp. BT771 TaxID=3063329 RepID=UPI0026E3BBC6|nr:response regulator transcription factor [Flavitalea sp. BT771]MDO6433001.1 response regulator transcription factor [Flavitalea sp. BT771]MDV6221723.1 response regulator transcription factor [Flavitalea sp. BT771]
MENVTLAIVDDHTLFRDGLVNLLREYDFIEVLFQAKSGIQLKENLQKKNLPDVILMDINMPSMDGHEATRWLKSNFPDIGIIALTMHEDESSIIRMLRNGAGGYVLKESNADELVRAISSVKATGFYINDLISGRLMRNIKDDRSEKEKQLSTRELCFLELCSTELTYKEIADQMHVSPRTVDGYREMIFDKFQVRSRTGMVIYAIRHNIIKIDG